MSDDEQIAEEWRGIAGTIILINVFDPSKKGTAEVAHAASLRMVRQYLRASTSHLIGVCLYGVENQNTTAALGIKSLVDVIPLSAPSLDDFKKLKAADMSSFDQAKELNMSDVLWHCSKMFANCKKQLLSRTVVVLTSIDVPPLESDQKPALKRVVDLVDSNIDINLVNVSKEEYKIHPFYENFLIEAHKGADFNIPRPLWDPREIEKLMHQQSHRHLAVARLKFEIGNGVFIGVGVYNLLIKSGYSQHKKVNLDQETNTKVALINKTMKIDTSTPQTMDVDDQEPKPMPLLKSEILHYQTYAGEKVEFTDNEMKQLKNAFGPPMIKLLGFKPATVLCKEKWFLKSGQFLYPNEGKIEGSTTAFKALHQACVEMRVVAICIMCTRVNSNFYLVALCPCTHPLGLDIEVGFDIIQIPFVESVRNLPQEGYETQVSADQKTLMNGFLKAVQFDYQPHMFENPKLNSEYRAIEAIALEEEDLEPFSDTTKPQSEKFENLLVYKFEQLFGPFGATAIKRYGCPEGGNTFAKRPKSDVLINEKELYDRIKYRTVHVFNIEQLKKILKEKGGANIPPLTGVKKSDLVDYVYKYCGL